MDANGLEDLAEGVVLVGLASGGACGWCALGLEFDAVLCGVLDGRKGKVGGNRSETDKVGMLGF